jgi:uncharacterized membrane protein
LVQLKFINPNLHVVLVHYPLALLISGTLIELFSFMWRRHAFRAAGRWMILLGALSGIPTAISGVYALYDVANPTDASVTWKEARAAAPLNAQQWTMLQNHLLLQTAATTLAVLVVIIWIGCSDTWRRRLHIPLLLGLLIVCGLTASGAWFGGEIVYRFGTGVSQTAPTTAPISVEYFLPPEQAHMILAGITVAIALAALALSVRNISAGAPVTQVDFIAAALGPPPTLIGPEGEDVQRNPFLEPEDVIVAQMPAARFWLLAALCALITFAAGVWLLASGAETWVVKDLISFVRGTGRRMVHVIVGGSIFVLSLILAILARCAPRQKWLLVIFATLLVVAVGVQVWLGILLLYDTPQGVLTHFN